MSKRIGGAVVRNRVKRLITENARVCLGEMAPGWDMLVVARSGCATASYDEIGRALRSLLKQSGVGTAERCGASSWG